MNLKREYGTPCERCGTLVYKSELNIELNGKIWHGSCLVQDEDMGSPFQCGICTQMAVTIRCTRDIPARGRKPKGELRVYACEDCIRRFKLTINTPYYKEIVRPR